MDAILEKKLRELIDRQEIWQVLQRYGRGLDRIDSELTRSCYFDDVIEDHGFFVGKVDEFIDWANQTSRQFTVHHHSLMNHVCDLQGDDAHCETYFLFIGAAEKPPHLMSMGRYVDHFQRRDGEWRIANRVTVIERNFSLFDSHLDPSVDSPYSDEAARLASRDRNDVSYQRPLRPRRPRST
jgi:predicted NAD-dependent protein-ADP-ribosyltransferase YbiA (DUF1768 family)